MISEKQIAYVSLGVFVCALGLWSVRTTNLFSISEKPLAQIPNDPMKKSKVMLADQNAASVPQTADSGTTLMPVAALPAATATSKIQFLTEAQYNSLDQYHEIKTKVFVSEKEKSLKKQFMTDNELIKSLKNFITEAPVSERGSDDDVKKNLALDLLIEASVSSNSAEATAALMDIVQDKKIEDEKIPVADRQSMAEIKADLLYTWTARLPNQASQIDKVIPGPVTSKIWKNAQEAQAQNRTESATTK
ncbi:MAG: hypothetical protein H7256_09035 [Bdellovibrio sp.]|nr:hypothetical protein [Bdellovibrio sp.]